MESLQAILFLLILTVLAMLLRSMFLRDWQSRRDLQVPEKNMKPKEIVVEPLALKDTRKEEREEHEEEMKLKEMLEQEQKKNYVSLDALQPMGDGDIVPVNIFG